MKTKHFISIAFIFVFAIAAAAAQQAIKRMPVKTVISPSSLICKAVKNSFIKKYNVSGKILATNPYCGGARPPQYILDEANIPNPVNACKVIIECAGKEVFSGETDVNGSFSTLLPPGKYSVFIGEQKESFSELSKKFKANGCYFDDNNLKEWLAKPCITFTVKDKDVNGLKAEFKRNCDTESFCNYIHKPNTRP
ncbi:MAG: hypothetical protein V2A54_00780 [Bacteroidota bacterium]